MEDIVDYKIPFGTLGRLMNPILVQPKLNEIFDFRRKRLIEMFGEI
jgi:ligand-binding SRPBCC domain-containing protein